MKTQMKVSDPDRAKAYFEAKIAFTTGPVELDRLMKVHDINVVDVRTPEDFQEGHIPGAVNLPREKWCDLSSLRKDVNNVIYCYNQQCRLAAMACLVFANRGFPVMELEGGFDAWKENELEVEQTQAGPSKGAQ
jgi:rhodanese-related sulfurtransferase